MATQFSVPSSPSKSTFEIDSFLGVDLTNSGTNIDENHSPNAVNMTRYVPSKVRKRMGYSDKVIFGNGTDVNRALATSDEYVTYSVPKLDDKYVAAKLADSIQVGENAYLRCTITANCGFKVMFGDGNGNYYGKTVSSAKTDYDCLLQLTNSGLVYDRIYVINASGDDADAYISIKDLIVCKKISTSASAMVWAKAPEDNGTVYVNTDSTEPVYGCHVLTNGTYDGDRVTNVNRALGTSSEETVFTIDSNYPTLYEFAETIPSGTTIYLDFDYKCSTNFQLGIKSAGGSSTYSSSFSSATDWIHWSLAIALPYDAKGVFGSYTSSTYTVSLKNFSVTYAKDSNYKWSLAPEESGNEFVISDVYDVSETNYADISECSVSRDSSSGTLSETFAISTQSMDSLTYLSFDLYTACDGVLTANEAIHVEVYGADNTKLYSLRTSEHMNNKHFDLILTPNTNGAVDEIRVAMYPVAATVKCTFSFTNIEIHKVVKKTSFETYSKYFIYHVGTNMYLAPNDNSWIKTICTDANEDVSSSWQMGNSIYILDGANIFIYDLSRDEVSPIGDEQGYIPTVTISKAPSGGGTQYDDLNLLQSGFYEMFYVSTATKVFYLSFQQLDNDKEVKAWILNSDATWELQTEGTNFSVDRASGIVTFFNDVSASPLTGEDNVKILAYRTVEGYADRIKRCTIGTLFGVNGASDRLFLSGNPDYPNYDWYSEQYDPTYFPDTGYSALGLETSAIVGYAIVNNYLTTFKDENEPSQSIFIREGDLVTDSTTKIAKPEFKLINTLQGAGAIAKHSFGYLQTEPLFLTRSGVFAITSQDISGEKYGQNRSFYLNGQLTEESNLEKAYAIVYNDMYLLAINSKVYILDGLQPLRTDKSEPYATRQYAAFYWENVPAICLWTDNQALWFGTSDGHVCAFATDVDALESYNDNGEAISCCWETPDIDGKLFYKNKSFRYIAIRMMSALKTSAKLWAMARGAWSFIKEDTTSGIFFDFENIDFESFSFSTDRSDKVAHSKIRVKKVDKARFKIENSNLNEPFGLMNLALEYVESGNYKG